MWRSVSEAFSGAVVEVMHGQFDLLRGDGFEGHLLWKELANQPIHVLVGAALPRRIRLVTDGIHPLPKRGGIVINALIDRLRDAEGI